MRNIFRPKHTLSSVAQRLASGLCDGSLNLERTIRTPVLSTSLRWERSHERPENTPSLVGILVAFLFWAGVAYVIKGSPDAQRLNIGISVMMLLAGLFIFFFFPPEIFKKYPYTRQAFLFWTLKWSILSCTWTLAHYLQFEKHLILMTSDLSSMLSLAFCWAFLSGKELKWRQFIQLAYIFIPLTLWNFEFHGGQLLIFPSEIVTFTAIAMTALVFGLRMGPLAISFVCVFLTAAMFQIPAYNQLILHSDLNVNLLAQPSLAAGKLLSGSIFYAMFSFSPASANFGTIKLPRVPRIHVGEPIRAIIFILLPAAASVAVLLIIATPRFLQLISFHMRSVFLVLGISFWVLFLSLKGDQVLALLPRSTRREIHGS